MGNVTKKIALFLLMISAFVNAATIFEDDFTSQTYSDTTWRFDANIITAAVAEGSCSINSINNQLSGIYRHTLSGTKPDIFTLSFVMNSNPANSGDAGMLFCYNHSSFAGYNITLSGSNLSVFYFPEGGEPIFYASSSPAINTNGNNKITVSKNGSAFNIFANDIFLGSFTDSKYSSGDISLYVRSGISAVFGPVSMTDQFTKEPKSFSDDFNDNNLKPNWIPLSNGSPEIKNENGKLKINAGSNDVSWMYVDLNLDNFSVKVEVSHSNGSNSSPYGIVLIGENNPGENIPMVHFGITGDNRYWLSTPNTQSITSVPLEDKINGSFGSRTDLLEVKKKSGSNAYEFLSNGNVLTDNYPIAPFKIIGVGIFCYNDLQIAFDDFYAADENPNSITWKPNQPSANGSKQFIKNSGKTFYDLMGRKRFSAEQSVKGKQTRAAGMYLNEQGKEIRVRKTPQK